MIEAVPFLSGETDCGIWIPAVSPVVALLVGGGGGVGRVGAGGVGLSAGLAVGLGGGVFVLSRTSFGLGSGSALGGGGVDLAGTGVGGGGVGAMLGWSEARTSFSLKRCRWRQGQGADGVDSDGARGRVAVAPVRMGAAGEESRRAQGRETEQMQGQRERKAGRGLLRGAGAAAGWKRLGGHRYTEDDTFPA